MVTKINNHLNPLLRFFGLFKAKTGSGRLDIAKRL